jgi:GT2 family glycosyltransferase
MISIIVPTYCPNIDVEEKLHKCIQSLLFNSPATDTEFVIVEQGIPATANMMGVLASGPRQVVYKRLAGPVGFARAVNMGVEMSVGDHLLIVNNDIEVGYAWAAKLVDVYDRTPRAGMISASDTPGNPAETIEAPCSWWSCVCISRKVWDRVGWLDEDKLNYRLHDQDWSIRAYAMGYVVGRFHGVKVKHDESSTYKHMHIDEGPERTEMRRRWGHEHFHEYVRTHPTQSSFL